MDLGSTFGNAHECARWNVTSALQSKASVNARNMDNDLGMWYGALAFVSNVYVI